MQDNKTQLSWQPNKTCRIGAKHTFHEELYFEFPLGSSSLNISLDLFYPYPSFSPERPCFMSNLSQMKGIEKEDSLGDQRRSVSSGLKISTENNSWFLLRTWLE